MRIAVWHDLPSGGGKRALYDHVACMVARGHHVESWCTPMADQEFLPLSRVAVEHIVAMRSASGSFERFASRLSKGATRTYATIRAMDAHVRACAEQIDAGGFDVVLTGSSLAVAASPIARYLATPAVLYLQEPKRSLYEAAPRLPWPALPAARNPLDLLQRGRDVCYVRSQRVLAREELENVLAYKRVLANSYFSRESMRRAYGIGARVCYLGVDTRRYRDLGLPREHFVVGVGEFSAHKRQDVAIRAVAQMGPRRPALAWVGNAVDHVYLRELEALARRLHVEFRPLVAIPQDEVVDVLNRASALVYAPRLEPFGYAPIEAGACGLPVVAKAEGGVRESVVDGETGFLVDEDDELAACLEKLLADPALARRLGAAGRANVEAKWSLGPATERLESHLAQAVSGSD